MQPWAGAGFGAQFLPRVGMEVMVAFVAGDVDRPIVAGCVHNGMSPPPFRYPEERTKLGIKSRVTPGGAVWNEISIDDARGIEQVFVRAERNLEAAQSILTLAAGPDGAMWALVDRPDSRPSPSRGSGVWRQARGQKDQWERVASRDLAEGTPVEATSLLPFRGGALFAGVLNREWHGLYRIDLPPGAR